MERSAQTKQAVGLRPYWNKAVAASGTCNRRAPSELRHSPPPSLPTARRLAPTRTTPAQPQTKGSFIFFENGRWQIPSLSKGLP